MNFKLLLKMVCPFATVVMLNACSSSDSQEPEPQEEPADSLEFYFGADLSYANQILDHGGVYMDSGVVKDPYEIFANSGTNLVRFRLWHNPTWTKEIYDNEGSQQYSDLSDVEKSIKSAREQGMSVLLDFHYSDTWTDPENQRVPAAWSEITSIDVLEDSVYNYTLKILQHLNIQGLMPELVQIGNEINCGFFYTDQPAAFPSCNVCEGGWSNVGRVINVGIAAVREVASEAGVDTKIALHVADPANVEWWFENITTQGGVSDFDIVGFSYYPLWHTAIGVTSLSSSVTDFKANFGKEVMVLEIAYPWTTDWVDDYGNLMGSETPISGYGYTEEGQLALMKYVSQSLIDAGAIGVIYWEPDWITSDMQDQWGTGSAWENCTFFDFDGNAIKAINYMNYDYDFE